MTWGSVKIGHHFNLSEVEAAMDEHGIIHVLRSVLDLPQRNIWAFLAQGRDKER